MRFKVHEFRKYNEPKLKKPKELNKVKSQFSVNFNVKCQCQCFIKENDLWIKHRDFFSDELNLDIKEIGMPLDYLVKKYMDKDKAKKFVYTDAWGSIVCRNEAWIVFEDIIDMIGPIPEWKITHYMLLEFASYHNCNWTELDEDWGNFFERIVKEIKRGL